MGWISCVFADDLWFRAPLLTLTQVKEELENDPEFFKQYSVAKGKGGMADPNPQPRPQTTPA